LTAGNLSTDNPDRVTAKATIVAEVERLHWRIWNGKAKNALAQHQSYPQDDACL
jgi:hypothetical protein